MEVWIWMLVFTFGLICPQVESYSCVECEHRRGCQVKSEGRAVYDKDLEDWIVIGELNIWGFNHQDSNKLKLFSQFPVVAFTHVMNKQLLPFLNLQQYQQCNHAKSKLFSSTVKRSAALMKEHGSQQIWTQLFVQVIVTTQLQQLHFRHATSNSTTSLTLFNAVKIPSVQDIGLILILILQSVRVIVTTPIKPLRHQPKSSDPKNIAASHWKPIINVKILNNKASNPNQLTAKLIVHLLTISLC